MNAQAKIRMADSQDMQWLEIFPLSAVWQLMVTITQKWSKINNFYDTSLLLTGIEEEKGIEAKDWQCDLFFWGIYATGDDVFIMIEEFCIEPEAYPGLLTLT